MREILFRGKRVDNCEWVEGWYFPLKHEDGTDHAYIIPVGQSVYTPIGKLFVEVNPSTVGQFTGLLDKNGKQIFEGDIVDYRHCFRNRSGTFPVIWDGYGFNCQGFYMPHYDNPCDAFSEGTEWFEVIGIVHDKEPTNE